MTISCDFGPLNGLGFSAETILDFKPLFSVRFKFDTGPFWEKSRASSKAEKTLNLAPLYFLMAEKQDNFSVNTGFRSPISENNYNLKLALNKTFDILKYFN